MSSLLKNQNTPQVLSGRPIDPDTKEKIKKRKQRILGLEIDINAPAYDDEGNLIYEESDEDEEEPEALTGIFNVHLLDEEVLDQQEYLGSATNSLNSSQQEEQITNKLPMEEEELQADFKKHLNVDFNSDYEEEQLRTSIPRKSLEVNDYNENNLAEQLEGFQNNQYIDHEEQLGR